MSIPYSIAGGAGSENKAPRLNASGYLAATMGGVANAVAILDGGALVPAGNAPAKAVYATGGAQALVPSDIGAASSADLTAAINGLDFKASVKASTTANITLSGAQTIDGISIVAADRVLVADQTTASENGVYVCATGSWTRATDADADAEVTTGLACFIEQGTSHGGKMAYLTTSGTIVVGTTSLAFARVAAFQLYTSTPAAVAGAGAGTAGTSAQAAKGDHAHPDTGLVLTDGSHAMAAALAMGTNKITGGAAATAATDFPIYSQVTGTPKIWTDVSTSQTLAWGNSYRASSTIQLDLPSADALVSGVGRTIDIWNVGTGVITVNPGAETINGSTTDITLTVQYESLNIFEVADAEMLAR